MEVQPDPPRAGQQSTLTFTVTAGGGAVGPGQGTCELVLDMPKMPMNLSPMTLDSDGQGRCQATYTFSMAGGWSAAVKVNGQQGAAGEARFDFDVGP